jgi:hypothetical protein
MRLLPPLAASALLLASAALAQTAAPPPVLDEAPASDNGRYAMQQTADGFLRLDTRTGKVSLCVVRAGVARCALAADERDAFEREIAQLKSERDAARAGRLAGDAPGQRLPSDKEIDRTLGVMEKIWRGMMRILRDNPLDEKGAPL